MRRVIHKLVIDYMHFVALCANRTYGGRVAIEWKNVTCKHCLRKKSDYLADCPTCRSVKRKQKQSEGGRG